ncbi:MAG: mobile mystery protein A [Proteobacteria bacterium]|nr:mobile mystery protein A [Pseudomonadota bacterium]MBU0967602.1 mobile mystery protein A [Pseudomonadota bacterium]
MKPLHRRLIQEQLETTFARLSCLRDVQRPAKGWLRAIREALGMSGRQFAQRLGVSPPWVTSLEKKELSDSVTIKTMRQAAEALDCVFVYALLPRDSLADIVHRRAEILAGKRLARVSHTMLLEDQQLSSIGKKKALEFEIDTLIRTMPKELWGNHDEF